MKKTCIYNHPIFKIITVLVVLWIAKTFLMSIPYKFSGHEVTQHIFMTIGDWISVTINSGLWIGFGKYAAYVIGSFEIVASVLLLIPAVIVITKAFGWMKKRKVPNYLFGLWGLLSGMLMTGAVFFHTQTPLWIEVDWDGGSLFKAAVSIMALGYALFIVYFHAIKNKFLSK
jgi:hypothetical protein